MTEHDIEAIRNRVAASTPGTWREQVCACGEGCWDRSAIKHGGYLYAECIPAQDAEMLCHAAEDLRALLSEVERLRAAIATASTPNT